jgi:hypothetical protein
VLYPFSQLPHIVYYVALSSASVLNYSALQVIQQQQLSLLSQASWGRLEMKPTENKNKKHKKGTSQKEELGVKQKVTKVTVQVR